MSQKTASCPNCGAPIQFRWSSAVQTTCPFCRSILVRRDVALEKVGEVADLPPDVSPLRIGAAGIYRNKAFELVGRILYQYEQGGWNEWHILFQDGSSGWLSDAQDEYAVSFLSHIEAPRDVRLGQSFAFGGVPFAVVTLTTAHYQGVEGELPFEYWDRADVLFADLRSHDARFATIDYSETPPLLFIGESVVFDELKLKNLRRFEGWS